MEFPPAGDGRNIRRCRANQGKARRSGTFFPDRIVCFPRNHDTPALTQGQRNQPKAQRIDPVPKAVVALSSCCSRRPWSLWISSHGAFLSGPHHAAHLGVSRERTRKGSWKELDGLGSPCHGRRRPGRPEQRMLDVRCAECLRAAQPVLIYAPSRSAPECRLPERNFL